MKIQAMLKSQSLKIDDAKVALQANPESESSRYIFPEETFESLVALGEILRQIHNRLEAEKAAASGITNANNVSILK